MRNRVAIIRHNESDGLGRLHLSLDRLHFSHSNHDLFRDSEAIPNLRDSTGLIVLGGEQSVNSAAAFWEEERRAVGEALELGLPVLGICLGAQLLASVLGAKVERMPAVEVGWHAVGSLDGAKGDLLFGDWGEQTVFHWHNECFALPAGAVALASSDACALQAFRYGDRAWGLQFHLEVEPRDIERWLREDAACGAQRECVEEVDAWLRDKEQGELAGEVFGRWAELTAKLGYCE